jgi:hypothetical protein
VRPDVHDGHAGNLTEATLQIAITGSNNVALVLHGANISS